MKVLNLYAGIGGNRKGWDNVDVTAIETHRETLHQYQRNYPEDRTRKIDALYYLETFYDKFDFIWASPPCDEWTALNYWTRHKIRPKIKGFHLYRIIDFCQSHVKVPWVVENVRHKFFIEPRIKIGKNYFWSNFEIPPFEHQNIKNYSKATKEELLKYLGIGYDKNIYDGSHDPCKVLRRAVHPDISRHILEAIKQEK